MKGMTYKIYKMRYFLVAILTNLSWLAYYQGKRNKVTDTYPPHAEGADLMSRAMLKWAIACLEMSRFTSERDNQIIENCLTSLYQDLYEENWD